MTAQSKQSTGIVAYLSNVFKNAIIDRCCERNCRLGLAGLSNCVVLKGEKIAKDRKMCDCIVIHSVSPPRIILVELKSGGVRAEHVIEKFENALQFLSQAEHNLHGNQVYNVNMLLLIKRRLPRTFYTRLRAQKFNMKGKKHSIMTLRCGAGLVDLYTELR